MTDSDTEISFKGAEGATGTTYESEFNLDTDASAVWTGPVLSQVQNGEEKVIAYSKYLSKEERKYCVTRKELLAVVNAVKYFHHYLYGRHFKVRSDHGALRWLTNFNKPEGQVARWFKTLSMYDFEVKFRAGRVHSNADALSRRPCLSDDCKYCNRIDNLYGDEVDVKGVARIGLNEMKAVLQRDMNRRSVEACVVPTGQKNTCVNVEKMQTYMRKRSGTVNESDRKQMATVVTGDSFTLGTDDNDIFTEAKSFGPEVDQSSFCENVSNVRYRRFDENVKDLRPEFQTYEVLKDGRETGLEGCHTPKSSESLTDCRIEDEVVNGLDKDLIRNSQEQDSVLSIVRRWKRDNVKPKWSEVAPMLAEVKYYWNRLDTLVIRDNMLYRRWESEDGVTVEYHIILPKVLVNKVMSELHDTPTGGHLGIKKTLFKVRKRFLWYCMKKSVTNWCKKCIVFASRKGPQMKARAKFQQYNVGEPLGRVGIDVMGPMTRTRNGFKYILTIVDYFTKWIIAISMRNQEANTVAEKFIEKFVSVFGVPRQIHSDQGSNFESLVFKEMCHILGSEKTRNK